MRTFCILSGMYQAQTPAITIHRILTESILSKQESKNICAEKKSHQQKDHHLWKYPRCKHGKYMYTPRSLRSIPLSKHKQIFFTDTYTQAHTDTYTPQQGFASIRISPVWYPKCKRISISTIMLIMAIASVSPGAPYLQAFCTNLAVSHVSSHCLKSQLQLPHVHAGWFMFGEYGISPASWWQNRTGRLGRWQGLSVAVADCLQGMLWRLERKQRWHKVTRIWNRQLRLCCNIYLDPYQRD